MDPNDGIPNIMCPKDILKGPKIFYVISYIDIDIISRYISNILYRYKISYILYRYKISYILSYILILL